MQTLPGNRSEESTWCYFLCHHSTNISYEYRLKFSASWEQAQLTLQRAREVDCGVSWKLFCVCSRKRFSILVLAVECSLLKKDSVFYMVDQASLVFYVIGDIFPICSISSWTFLFGLTLRFSVHFEDPVLLM